MKFRVLAGSVFFLAMAWYLLIAISGLFLAEMLIDQGNPPDAMVYRYEGISLFSGTPFLASKAMLAAFLSSLSWFGLRNNSKVLKVAFSASAAGLVASMVMAGGSWWLISCCASPYA